MEQSKGKKLILTIALALAALAVYKIAGFGLSKLDIGDIPLSVLKELVFLAAAVVVAIIVKELGNARFTRIGMGQGFLAGAYFIILPSLLLIMTFVSYTSNDITPTLGGGMIGLLLVEMLLVGMTEELLFRGTVQNVFHDFFGEDSQAHVRLALICAGAVFGSIHLGNVFNGVAFSGAMFQAIANIPAGMMFGAVYFRSRKNLWVCILLHAFLDLAGSISGGILIGVDMASQISQYGVTSLILPVVQIAIFIFLTRKKKIMPLLKPAE